MTITKNRKNWNDRALSGNNIEKNEKGEEQRRKAAKPGNPAKGSRTKNTREEPLGRASGEAPTGLRPCGG
jgi:hypothetical protein